MGRKVDYCQLLLHWSQLSRRRQRFIKMVVSVNVLRGSSGRAGVSSSSSSSSSSLSSSRNVNVSIRERFARRQRGEKLVVRGSKKTFHTVQKGEWLSSIAPKYDVTTEQLRDANVKTIEEGDIIYPGQQLLVPVATSGGMSLKGILVKVVIALLVLAAASGIWPTIKESQEQNK